MGHMHNKLMITLRLGNYNHSRDSPNPGSDPGISGVYINTMDSRLHCAGGWWVARRSFEAEDVDRHPWCRILPSAFTPHDHGTVRVTLALVLEFASTNAPTLSVTDIWPGSRFIDKLSREYLP